MLKTHTAKLPIALTNDEIHFIIELCTHELDIDTKLKLEFARTWKDNSVTISMTPAELHALVELLLRKAEHANEDVRDWAEDIATWLTEQT